jgi:tetratricopeptide (TPR) repeat protein
VPPVIQALAFAAVAAAALLVNLSTLGFEFLTSWDDLIYVVDNPWIRGFTRENLVHAFSEPYYANFLPLHLVSYMIDYSLWGLDPFGYHLQSVLLNALNAALALCVVWRLFGNFSLAFLTALLFAVHPSHVEAVAWVSIRKDLLSTTFLLLTVHGYLRATDDGALRRIPYVASVVCFTLGLLSKLSSVALPLFLLLVDALPRADRRKLSWQVSIASKLPYAVIALWLLRLNLAAQVTTPAAYAQEPLAYLMVKGSAVWKYLGLLTGIPEGRPIYDMPQDAAGFWPVAANLAGLAVLPVVIALTARRSRTLALGAGWVLALLLPALLFPLMTYMAERYLYAASIGFCWCLAEAILRLGSRGREAPLRLGVAAALAAIPLLGFSYRTLTYNQAWSSPDAFWSYAIERSEDRRVHNNLAQLRVSQERFAEAERLYEQALEVENYVSYQGLATVYYVTQRYAEAERAIDRALEIAGQRGAGGLDLAEIEYTRGAIAWAQGKHEPAIEAWESALRANPRHEKARAWLDGARQRGSDGAGGDR